MLPRLFTPLSRTVAASSSHRWDSFFLAPQRCGAQRLRSSITDRIRLSKSARQASSGLGLQVRPIRAARSVCLGCLCVYMPAHPSIGRCYTETAAVMSGPASAVHVFSPDANVDLYEGSPRCCRSTPHHSMYHAKWSWFKYRNMTCHRLNIVRSVKNTAEGCFLNSFKKYTILEAGKYVGCLQKDKMIVFLNASYLEIQGHCPYIYYS